MERKMNVAFPVKLIDTEQASNLVKRTDGKMNWGV